MDQVIDTNLDTNVKLLEWLERRFQSRVNEKIFTKIALSQVEMAKKIDHVIEVLGNISSLYAKLCNTTPFKHEVGQQILKLENELKFSSQKLFQNTIHTEQHFHTLLQLRVR